jgi:hypothetical protein
MTAPGPSTTWKRCGCGQCGIAFEVVEHYWGRPRRFAPDCPMRGSLVREANRQAARKSYARVREMRRCQCGCGKTLPPRVWYHPECASRAKAKRDGVAGERAPGKRCSWCMGMSWRRDERYGCSCCGLKYAPERIARTEAAVGSSLAGFEVE